MAFKDFINKTAYITAIPGLATSLAASATDNSTTINLTLIDETIIAVQITCTFNASATDGMTVKLLSSLDVTTFDDASDPLASGNIPVQAGATATKTFHFQVYGAACQVRIENDDATYSITSISGNYYVPPRQPAVE